MLQSCPLGQWIDFSLKARSDSVDDQCGEIWISIVRTILDKFLFIKFDQECGFLLFQVVGFIFSLKWLLTQQSFLQFTWILSLFWWLFVVFLLKLFFGGLLFVPILEDFHEILETCNFDFWWFENVDPNCSINPYVAILFADLFT